MRARNRGALVALIAATAFVALSGSAGAAARPVATGTVYGGYTSQDAPLVVTLDRTHTAIRSVGIYVMSQDGYVFGDTGHAVASMPPFLRFGDDVVLGAKISRSGAFSAKGTATAGYGGQPGVVTYTFTGKVKGDHMQGTLKAKLALSDPATNQLTKTVSFGTRRWVADSRPGRVFGGAMTSGDPVVIELNTSGHVAKFVRIPWNASSDTTSWAMPETFTDLSVPAGAFSRTWSTPYTRDDGGVNTFAYDLKLRVTKTKATGTLQVKVTEASAAGVVEATCDSGAHTFSAASSR